jgi:hypothetical protein
MLQPYLQGWQENAFPSGKRTKEAQNKKAICQI